MEPDANHGDDVPFDALTEHHKARYRQMARAAIAAMREPTEAMVKACIDGRTV